MTQTQIRARIKQLEEEIDMIIMREVMPLPGVDMAQLINNEIEKREREIEKLRRQLI